MSTRPNHPFDNDSNQSKRREVTENDRFFTARERREELLKSGEGGTFHGFATGGEVEDQHSRLSPRHIVGRDPNPYPKGPNWSQHRDPDERPMDGTKCGDTFGEALGGASKGGETVPGRSSSCSLAEMVASSSGEVSGSDTGHHSSVVETASPHSPSNDDDPPPDAA